MSRYKQPYSLYKRGDYWYYRTYTPDGVRTSGKTTGCTSKNAAKDYCNKLYLSGSLYTSEKTFFEYAAHFYDDKSPYVKDRLTPLSENTLRGYRIKMSQYIMPFFGKKKMGDINYTMLKNFRIKMLNDGYAASNVISTLSCLKHIIDNAYRDRIISVNPFSYLEPMNVPTTNRDAFTLEEIKILYNSIGEEFRNTILLMAITGTRISEAIGITINDVKKAEKCEYIDLHQQYNLKKYKPLKGKNARPIPIIPEIKELFGFEPTRLPAFYRTFQPIKKKFENYKERDLAFHSLRHFFITSAKSNGINDIKVEYIAGHSLKGITKFSTWR